MAEEQSQGGMQSLRFPSHYGEESGDHWMMYKRKKYSRPTKNDPASLVNVEGAKMIALPLPNNLAKSYVANWTDEEIGATGAAINDIAQGALNTYRKSRSEGKTQGSSIMDTLASTGTLGNGQNLLSAKIMDVVTTSDTFKATGKITGMARNPFKAVLFNQPNFRTFSFEYHFVATNYEESNTIRDILKEFELGMSPDYVDESSNLLFTYPDIFAINFEKESHLFKIAPCVLTEITSDFHAEGKPLYFYRGDDRVPASIRLSLSFREIVVLTRKDFKEGY